MDERDDDWAAAVTGRAAVAALRRRDSSTEPGCFFLLLDAPAIASPWRIVFGEEEDDGGRELCSVFAVWLCTGAVFRGEPMYELEFAARVS